MSEQKEFVYVAPLNHTFTAPIDPIKCKWEKDAPPSTSVHTKAQRTAPRKVYDNVFQLIGNTPMVKLNNIPKSAGLKCNVYAKCEFFNPSGSLKDRIARRMIEDAEKQGVLKPGDTIIEPSSGNTGTAVALAAAVKGYPCIIVMSEKMSNEKEWMITALGAKLVRTPITADSYSPDGLFGVAYRLKQEIPNSLILNQFSNPANPLGHYDITSEEILDQLDGKVDMIVMGAGTGGTLTGIARKFKEVSPHTQIIGADPEGSAFAYPDSLNETDTTFWEVEGMGYEFIPPTLDRRIIDKWYKTNDYEAMPMARRLIAEEGLLCGASSGAITSVALKAAKNLPAGKNVVVILPDGVRNYMTKFVSLQWMEERHLLPTVNQKNHWWWDLNVLELKPKQIPIITPSTTCQEALDKIKQLGVNVIAIVKPDGNILGALTSQHLTKNLVSGNMKSTDTVERVAIRIFHKAHKSDNLGLVSRILEIGPYVVIYDSDGKGVSRIDRPIGVVESSDLLDFINANKPN